MMSTLSYCQLPNPDLTAKRILNIKQATVQVIIDSFPTGTGFFCNSEGTIATNMHVISNDILKVDSMNRIISKIEVRINDGSLHEVKISDFFTRQRGVILGKSYDFIWLEPKEKIKDIKFLELGNFSDLKEGDNIYTCGYPFGISQPVFTSGIVSTKFKIPVQNTTVEKEVAWLDLSMNSGNSGGAVMVMKSKPEDDFVVGIASFNLNVFASQVQEFKKIARNRNAVGSIGGLDIKKFAELTAESIESSFYGIGGVISINHLKSALN